MSCNCAVIVSCNCAVPAQVNNFNWTELSYRHIQAQIVTVNISTWIIMVLFMLHVASRDLSSLSHVCVFLFVVVHVEGYCSIWSQWDTPSRYEALDEWSVCRKSIYLHNTNKHKRQTSIAPSEIRTHDPSNWVAVDLTLDSTAIGIGLCSITGCIICS